jgi:WD40 repeat protein
VADRRPIFISYRRDDEPGYAGWLYELASAELGRDRIFKDIEGGLRDGDDFPDELARRVADSDVVLTIIGPAWLTVTDEAGRRRLDNPADWVRIETATALKLGKRVIPVLVNGAHYLQAEELPGELKPLARKQTRRLSNHRFGAEAKVLVAALPAMIAEAEAERADAWRRTEAQARRRAEDEAARRREEAADAEVNRRHHVTAGAEAPTMLSPQAIEEARELANWNFIAPRRDVAEHRDHLSRYPQGGTARWARTALEELVWEATDPSSPDELRAFLHEFPDGENAVAAGRQLRAREAEAAARRKAERRAIEERLAWADISVSDDKAAIREFLERHPDGANAEAARKRLAELGRHPTRRLVLAGATMAALGGAAAWQMQPGGALWWRLVGPGARTFRGHTGPVNAVAFAPDGHSAISGSNDGTMRLWDIATGESLRTFTGHAKGVAAVAFAPDGATVLSGSDDMTVRLWELATGKTLRTFAGHSSWVLAVAFAAGGANALSGCGDRTLGLWDVETGRGLHVLRGHSGEVWSVAVSRDGRRALSGSVDRTLRLWDLPSGDTLGTFTGHDDVVTSVAFGPDGRRAVSGSYDRTVRLWDLAADAAGPILRGHQGFVLCVAFAPDGTTALSGDTDGQIRLWDVETGKTLRTFAAHKGSVRSVALAPDGTTALSGGADSTVRLWPLVAA